jgi:Zn-dependent protease
MPERGDPQWFAFGVVWYVVFLFSTVLHEAAHALAAKLQGDETSANQVSVDPLPHIQREPFGMVLVPMLGYAMGGMMIGWASTPYDPHWADRYPHRAARMALAGPLANLLLAVIAAGLIRMGVQGDNEVLGIALHAMFVLNVLLFAFNLLPCPPLDGSSVVALFMSESTARRWHHFIMQPGMAFGFIILAWALFTRIGYPILAFAERVLLGGR